MSRKKNLIAKKHLIVCTLPETEDHIDSFQVDVSSPYHLEPLKTSDFLYFQSVKKTRLDRNGLTIDKFSYLR